MEIFVPIMKIINDKVTLYIIMGECVLYFNLIIMHVNNYIVMIYKPSKSGLNKLY